MLSFQGCVDGAVHRFAIRRHAGEPLHDRGGGFRSDTAHVPHRARARRCNAFFGFRQLQRQPLFEPLAVGFRSRVQLFAGLVTDRLRAGARTGEFAFIGFQGLAGGIPQFLRLGQIAIDRVLTRVEEATDPWLRISLDDQI